VGVEMESDDETILDTGINPDIKLRATFDWLIKWRKVIEKALFFLIPYNILGFTLFQKSSQAAYDIAYSFGVGLGACFISAIFGTFIGLFIAIFPLKKLPYYLKLPLTTLSGILLVNLLLSLVISARGITLLLGF